MLLAERLAQKPSASIPGACESWAETSAAYRFLRNDEVSWDKVLVPHWQASQARMAQHRVVLCIQVSLMVKARDLGYPADYLVRSKHQRHDSTLSRRAFAYALPPRQNMIFTSKSGFDSAFLAPVPLLILVSQGDSALSDICLRHGIAPGQLTVHSDNGAPMKGEIMLATMQRLGVAHTRSRPAVSN